MRYRPVFKTHGGKAYLWEWIVGHFPKDYETMNYGESCVGGGSIVLNKEKSAVEFINDGDPGIANLYTYLINGPNNFIHELSQIQYSEPSFNWAKENKGKEPSLTTALAELCIRRMSRGGLCENFSWSGRKRGGRPGDLNAFETFKEHIKKIADRLKDVTVENYDILEFISNHDNDNWFMYLDPPYLPSTRKSKKAYSKEMTEEEHGTLCDFLNTVKSKVLISGYYSPLYMKKLKNWNFDTMPVVNHSSQSKKKEMRIECLWRNY